MSDAKYLVASLLIEHIYHSGTYIAKLPRFVIHQCSLPLDCLAQAQAKLTFIQIFCKSFDMLSIECISLKESS